jgi:crotonobetainyl-CoA:carnitine CoA-transferase CaiB-like acyl-CoA transferase
VLGAQELKFVRTLLGEFGRPDLVALAARGPGPHQQPLIDFLRERFATRSRDEWVEWFAGRDIGFAPVKDLREAFDDPQAEARGMRLRDADGIEHIGLPVKFRDEPGQPRFTLPAIGEHNRLILRTLGYDDAAIDAMDKAR